MIKKCPECFDALDFSCREAGLETYMVSDIYRLALGETLTGSAYPSVTEICRKTGRGWR